MTIPKFLQVLLGLLLAVLTVFVGLKSWNAYAEHYRIGVVARDRDTITVGGEGKVKATPDLTRITLGVKTDGATVQPIQTENTRKMNAIIAMLKQEGITEEDIQTERYAVSPRYNWDSGQQNLIGYTVNQNVSVKVRDQEKTGTIIGKAGELGANQVGGIDFMIDDPTALQDQAREKAIADAKKKADALARQLGITIVKVVSFSESGHGNPTPYYKAYDLGVEAMAGNAASAPNIEVGSEEVLSNVTVIFEVR